MFSKNGLKIIIEVNKKIVNFFDVILNLNNGFYELYVKFNNILFYVYSESNYLYFILKNIFLVINKRFSEILLNKEFFDKVVFIY